MTNSSGEKETPRQYRKKPVVIEAVRWTGANIEEVLPFFGDFSKLPRAPDDPHVHQGIGHCPPEGTLDIPTLEGTMTARAGDWIIKGVKGEFYPCKPDIFEATYELAAPLPSLNTPSVNEWERAYQFVGKGEARWANAYHDLLAFARQREATPSPQQQIEPEGIRSIPREYLERYPALVVTGERHGSLTIPLFHVVTAGDALASAAIQLHEMTKDRDHWKREAESAVSSTAAHPDNQAVDAEAAWYEWRECDPNASKYEAFIAAYTLGAATLPSPAVRGGRVNNSQHVPSRRPYQGGKK